MFPRIRAAPSFTEAARRVAQEADGALTSLTALPVRRASLTKAFEGTRQALHGGAAASPDAIKDELSKFTGELLRSAWTSHLDPNPKIAAAVSEIFAIGHGHLLSLETLAQYASFRNPEGAVRSIALRDSVDDILSSARALGVEKFGVHPRLDVRVGTELIIDPAAVPLLEFALIELLKNAFGAMIERHGALEVEDAPPVKIHLEGDSQSLERVWIEDFGTGMEKSVQRACFQPLVTTLVDDREDPWKYSRTFGAKFAGAGLGAFRARLGFLHLGAREINLRSDMGVGTAIEILFNDDGNDRGRAEEESDADGAKENDLCKHTVVQLKDMLRGKGLVVSGRKSELIQRLEEAEKREGF